MKLRHILYLALSFVLLVSSANAQLIIDTFAGNGPNGLPATLTGIGNVRSVAVDGSGNLFIADQNNQRIYKVDANGTITIVAGTGVNGFAGDGGPATAGNLSNPMAVAVDNSGNLFIADFSNQRIRKVDTSGVINTVAGTGLSGFAGDGGPATAARLNDPRGLTVDNSGNLYIADSSNNRIRKVDTTGIISTVAGTGATG